MDEDSLRFTREVPEQQGAFRQESLSAEAAKPAITLQDEWIRICKQAAEVDACAKRDEVSG